MVQWLRLSFPKADPRFDPWSGNQIPHTTTKILHATTKDPTCVCAKSLQSCQTPCDPVDCKPIMLLCPGDSPGKNTRVGCHALLQGIFPTQGLNLYLFTSPALVDGFLTTSITWETPKAPTCHNKDPKQSNK